MKKSLLILFAIIFAISLNTQAEDFSAVYNGDTIYYNITSSTSPRTVAVTYRGAGRSSYSNEYSGTVSIPDSVLFNNNYYKVTSIGNNAFYQCSELTSIAIPNTVTSIGIEAFKYCSGLTSITIPNSVISIGNDTFYRCNSLTSITIPNSVTSIGDRAFYKCTGLTSVTIPNSVTSIGSSTFEDCINLDTVYFNANNCTKMGTSMFYVFDGCFNFRTLIIGDSVQNIPHYAFSNCNLSSITSKAINPPAVLGSSFSGVSKTIPFYVPCNSIPSYNSAMYWSDFTNYVGIRTPQFIASSICDGSIYTDYGANIDSAGVYTLVNGCDSVILNLSITPSFKTNYYDTICKGVQYSNYGFSFIVDSNGVYIRELQAINGCDSIIQLNLKVIESPTVELNMVTVDMNNNNNVIWDKDEVVNHYNIYKEGNVLNQYDLIATVPYDSASMFVDTNSNPTIKAYMYKISTTDTCLNESELSSFHKTMHLTISQGIGNNWNLYWSPYEGAYYTTYNIYRGLNSLDSLEYLTTISSSNTSYTDIDVPSQIVYYQVEIIKDTNTTNKSGIQSIRSNIVTNNTIGLNNIHKNNITTKLYPNPTEGKAKLEIEGLNSDADVLVYDMVGRVVQRHSLNKGKNDLEIDLSGYAKGVYSVRIVNDSVNQTLKLIVR